MPRPPVPRRSRRRLPALHAVVVLAVCASCAPTPPPADTPVTDPGAIPKIDLHSHYRAPHESLLPGLESWNMRSVLVNVTAEADHPAEWEGMRALQAAHPDRFLLCGTFDPFLFNEPDFVERTLADLRRDLEQGARCVKVWKNVGMEVKDAGGRHVQIDHPRFQPIWDFLAERGVPVLAHIGEPIDAWRPLTEESPHHGYYSTHPEYHAYANPAIPRWETIIEARDRWIERNPGLVIVGAHLGSTEFDVDEVARRLDRYPNFNVETAARLNNLAMQPSEKVRDFFIRYQDRIHYGTDLNGEHLRQGRFDDVTAQYWRYLSSPDTVLIGNPERWHRRPPGLGLPRGVLEKIYHRNTEKLLGI